MSGYAVCPKEKSALGGAGGLVKILHLYCEGVTYPFVSSYSLMRSSKHLFMIFSGVTRRSRHMILRDSAISLDSVTLSSILSLLSIQRLVDWVRG